MKNKKIIIAVIILIVLAVTAYIIIKKRKAAKEAAAKAEMQKLVNSGAIKEAVKKTVSENIKLGMNAAAAITGIDVAGGRG